MKTCIILAAFLLCATSSLGAETQTAWFSSQDLATDGIHCGQPEAHTINSGPTLWVVNCSDNAKGILTGMFEQMEKDYDGGPITFRIRVISEDTVPSGTFGVDFSAKCARYNDETPWGTSVTAFLRFNEQYHMEESKPISVLPNGICKGKRPLTWRAAVNPTLTATQMDRTYVLGVVMEYELKKRTVSK